MTTLLAIDAGNTRIKWGVYEIGAGKEATRLSGGVAPHDDVVRIFAEDVPRSVIASNVAGAHIASQLQEQCRLNNAELHIIASRASQCGVTNNYRNPAQLGSDRWAALIGARRLGEGAKLVVMAGTATTVDALTAEGVFLGGLIVPGVTLMRAALNRNTAQLGPEAGQFETFPQSTPDAIMSGAIQASAGAIERMYEELAAREQSVPEVILSGGAAPDLLPRLPFAASVYEHLVLEGLVEIARQAGRETFV
jgi:type III pantothenate kinase